MPNVAYAKALVGALFPTTLGWAVPTLFGHYPPRVLPVYAMRKVSDTEVSLRVREIEEEIKAWLARHV